MNPRYSIVQLVPPTDEPVSVAEMASHLRIDSEAEGLLLESYIKTARQYVEMFTRRQLVQSTWKMSLDTFPTTATYDEGICLPNPPLISVSGITYVADDGTSTTLASSVYTVDRESEPAVIRLAYDQSWPTVRGQRNAIAVTYLAGYGGQTKTRIDLATVLAGQTLIVNGLTYTAHSTTTTVASREFAISGSNAADATALVSCLNDATYGVPNVSAANTDTAGNATARVTLTPVPGTDITATPSAATMTVSTNFECTAGESIAAVPGTLKHAIRLLVGHWFEHREAIGNVLTEIPLGVDRLLWGERVLEA